MATKKPPATKPAPKPTKAPTATIAITVTAVPAPQPPNPPQPTPPAPVPTPVPTPVPQPTPPNTMNQIIRYGLTALVALAAIFAATKLIPQFVGQQAPAVTGNADANDAAIQGQIDTLKSQTADGFTAVNSRLDGLDQAIKNLQGTKAQPIEVHVEVNPRITMPATSGFYVPPPTPTYTPPPAPPPPAPAPKVTTVYRDSGERVVYRDRGSRTQYVGSNYGYQNYGYRDYGNYGGFSVGFQSRGHQGNMRPQHQQPSRPTGCLTRGNGPGPTSGSQFRPGSSGRGGVTPAINHGSGSRGSGSISRSRTF